MEKVRSFLVVAGCLLSLMGAKAQIGFGGTPPSFQAWQGKSLKNPPVQVVEHALDVEQLLQEEAEAERLGMPPKVAEQIPVHYTLENAGRWDSLPDGTHVWRLHLKVPGALALLASYHAFVLPEGVSLFVYNGDRSRVLGAYTQASNPGKGRFSTEMLAGDEICFELVVGAGLPLEETLARTRFSIDGIGYCFNKISVRYLPGMPVAESKAVSSWCMINVNCEEGEDWQVDKKSVCKMLMLVGNAWSLCTGTVMNNTAQDMTPYVATAYHCLSGQEPENIDFSQWQFIFDYEAPACEDAQPLESKTLTGAYFRAGTKSVGESDGLLLELASSIPRSWGVYYSGWDRREQLSEDLSGTNIHHPQGDLKKISKAVNLVIATWSASNGQGDAEAHFQVDYAYTGNGRSITESGSSGSGLRNKEHRLIATLTGGDCSCANTEGHGYYGRLSHHWNHYGTDSSSRFEPWLDPVGSGAEVLDGIFTDPTLPDLQASRPALEGFRVESPGEPSPADTFSIHGTNLRAPVSVWTTAPFELSSDAGNWALETVLEIAEGGTGTVHVRYAPSAPGRDTAWVYACSEGSDTVRVKVRGDACPDLQLEPEVLETAAMDEAYRCVFQVQGPEADYRFEQAGGRLPQGLGLGEDGQLTGIPEETGLFDFYIRVSSDARCDYVFRRTLYVDGGLVSEFPWQESFETGTIPDAWSLAPLEGTADWQIMSGMGVSGAAIQGAAEGRYNAVFRAQSYQTGWRTLLVTPRLDLSSLENPRLVFSHAQPLGSSGQDRLRVLGRASVEADWEELAVFKGDISAWQDDTLSLPLPTESYFIAFEGIFKNGNGVALDYVRIGDAGPASVMERQGQAPVLYNNPVRDMLRVDFAGRSFNHAHGYDLQGRKVMEKILNPGDAGLELSLEALPEGLYYLVLEGKEGRQVLKVLKTGR